MATPSEGGPTCEWIFTAGSGERTYPAGMDGGNFIRWIKEQYIPTFEALFPGKRAVLVLDNAPYHHTHNPTTFIDVTTMSKAEMLDKMAALGLESCVLDRDETKTVTSPDGLTTTTTTTQRRMVIPLDEWLKAGKVPDYPKGPRLEEMQAMLLSHIETHHPVAIFRHKGWGLIFLPPHSPQYQPMHLVWDHVKGYAMHECIARPAPDGAAEPLRDIFRGRVDPARWAPVDCETVILHCEKEILAAAAGDEFLQDHAGNVGAIMLHEVGVISTHAQLQAQRLREAEAEADMDHDGCIDSDEDDSD
eukprot:m.258907 g.258907  ORF g.258907 m.258907 type:complete len:304 (-) comp22067_c0_seq1:101-1012(-)